MIPKTLTSNITGAKIIKNKISIPSEDNNLLDFKYKDKYYEYFFCIYKRSSRYSIFNIKNYKGELLNSIIRIEVHEQLKNIYKFKYILIYDESMEIINIKKVDRFYDF